MTAGYAPVVLFAYNRPEHTKRTIEALAANELAGDTELYIFSDAPKREEDAPKVAAIREYAVKVTGFASVTLVSREKNFGLAKNIIRGVTEIVTRYGTVIVLEDDLVTNRFFLRYMNDGLNRYGDVSRVTGITGFSHFDDDVFFSAQTYFHTLTGTSWSWATWSDRWACFDEACANWEELVSDKKLRKKFNYDNTYDFYKILKMQQTDEKTDSWAIRWYWTNFKRDGYILSPARSLVANAGMDGSGTHFGVRKDRGFHHELRTDAPITEFPDEVFETKETHRLMKRALIREWEPSRIRHLYHIVMRKNYIGQA